MSDQATSQTVSVKERRKSDRRTSIVEVARRRFRETGLAETTLDLVAEDAQIARPNLYRYFKNKAALVSAVLVVEAQAINAYRLEKLEGIEGFGDRLVRSFQATAEAVDVDALWADIVSPVNVPYTAYIASSDSTVLESNMQYWVPMLDEAERRGELRPGLDREDTMKWLLGLEFMFMERKEIFSTPEDVDHFVRTYVLPGLVKQ